MAALTTQNIGNGGPVTTQAASAGGDSLTAGRAPAGWYLEPTFLFATVGTTATTLTVGGVAFGPYTSQTVCIPVNVGTKVGTSVAVTYNQVVNVAVGAVQFARDD